MEPGKTYISKRMNSKLWKLTEARVATATPEDLAAASHIKGLKSQFHRSLFIIPLCYSVAAVLVARPENRFLIGASMVVLFAMVILIRYMIIKKQPRYIQMSQYAWYFYEYDINFKRAVDESGAAKTPKLPVVLGTILLVVGAIMWTFYTSPRQTPKTDSARQTSTTELWAQERTKTLDSIREKSKAELGEASYDSKKLSDGNPEEFHYKLSETKQLTLGPTDMYLYFNGEDSIIVPTLQKILEDNGFHKEIGINEQIYTDDSDLTSCYLTTGLVNGEGIVCISTDVISKAKLHAPAIIAEAERQLKITIPETYTLNFETSPSTQEKAASLSIDGRATIYIVYTKDGYGTELWHYIAGGQDDMSPVIADETCAVIEAEKYSDFFFSSRQDCKAS